MDEFLSKWTPGHFLGLSGIIFGAMAVVAIVWLEKLQSIRLARIAAELKQEMLRRGLSVGEIERLLKAPNAAASPSEPETTDEEAIGEVAASLAAQGALATDIEKVMVMLRSADSQTRRAVYQTVSSMAENSAEADQMIAAVRGLCRPALALDEVRSVMADS